MNDVRNAQLVRTCVDGDDHTLVFRQSAGNDSRFDLLFDLLPDDGLTDALAITYRKPEQFLRRWRERTDRRPRNLAVLSVGEQMRSAAANAPTPVEQTPLYGIADPADTDEIRRTTAAYLDAWPDDGRAVVYFDSITALRDHLDPDEAVAFLADLRETLDDRNAAGYFRMTPAAHDSSVVQRVGSQFDTVVECAETGRAAETPSKPPVDDCLDAMADSQRRHLLAAVAHGEGVAVGELADYVAERTAADRRAVRVSLVNVHLPKLTDLGLVAYDRDDESVAPGVHFEAVVPLLRNAPDVDAAPDDPTASDDATA